MNQHGLNFLSIALSAAACALAGFALSRPRSGTEPTRAADPDDGRIGELARQVAALRSDFDRFAAAPRDPPLARTPAVEPGAAPPDLLQRISGLEESVSALQRRSSETPPRADPAAKESAELLDARRKATAPRASEAEKLAALRALRGRKFGDQDAISTDVLLSMLDLAEHSPNEATRVDVYRNLHKVPDPALRDSMLRALAGDPSAKVREKVAQDIDSFLPDPGVEAALRQAADGDPDPSVRAAASKTLAGGR